MFTPFPILTSERLYLRQFSLDDKDITLYLRSDEVVNQFIKRPENRKTKTIQDAIDFIEMNNKAIQSGESITWSICFKDDSEAIGNICFWNFSEDRKKAEVGYSLHPDHQSKGIMSESLQLILEYGKNELVLNEVVAYTQDNNLASIKMLEKNGFKLDAEQKDENNSLNRIYIKSL